VRTLLTSFLIGMLLACPAMCRIVEVAHQPGCGEAQDEGSPAWPAPDPCRDECVSCICDGAVQADDARVPDLASVSSPWDSISGPIACPLAVPPGHHLSHDGRSAGLAGWRDAVAVRALLQNFRC
jgi:hypothetical protein